ncbi:peptide deformylase, partial [Escherichia coli]|nr:peptide deformylase [Escherichia coli]HCN9274951.1 peptide deformylase [Escherichia coli]HDT5110757.1 peptide deformylase [Escherichia coli]
PEQRALVPRAEKVKIRALDRDGKPFELEADGLLAICIGLRLGNGKYCTLRLFFNQV